MSKPPGYLASMVAKIAGSACDPISTWTLPGLEPGSSPKRSQAFVLAFTSMPTRASRFAPKHSRHMRMDPPDWMPISIIFAGTAPAPQCRENSCS